MSLARAFIGAAGLLLVMKAAVASACSPSGWVMTVTDPCLAIKIDEGEESFVLHNHCTEEVALRPQGCDAPCAEVVSIPPKGTATFALPDAPKDQERTAFDYMKAEQSGTLELEYELNECPDEGGCSTASTSGGSGAWFVLVLVAGSRLLSRRTRRPVCPPTKLA